MKLQQDNQPVETFGAAGIVDFGIRNQDVQKLLTILGQNFYSNPVQSMVRELITNARDAHLDANNTHTPIKIYLPSTMSPQFVIRDFGNGMSQEFLETVYVSFGASTKAASNNSNGAFGLGSKSPFAVSPAWSVNSYHNGTKYTYTAFTSDSGGRQMMFAGTSETQEMNGVEVVVPLERKHREAVQQAVRFYGRWWETRPLIDDESYGDDWWGSLDTILKGSNWAMMEDRINSPNAGDYYYNYNNVFKLGDVPYLVSSNHDALQRGLNSQQKFFLDKKLFLEFPIGDLQPTPNRENIVFDSTAISKIAARLNIIQQEIDSTIQKSIVDAESLAAAIKILTSSRHRTPTDLSNADFKWKNYSVATSYKMPRGVYLRRYSTSYDGKLSSSRMSQRRFDIINRVNTRVYFNDLGKKRTRMQAIKTLAADRWDVYILEPQEYLEGIDSNNQSVTKTGEYSDLSAEIQVFVDGKLSDVTINDKFKPKAARKSNGKIDRTKFRGYLYENSWHTDNRGVRAYFSEQLLDKDPVAPQYYLPIKGPVFDPDHTYGVMATENYSLRLPKVSKSRYGSYKIEDNSTFFDISKKPNWGAYLYHVRELLEIDSPLYGIPSARIPKLGGNWVNFLDYLKTLVPLYEDSAMLYMKLRSAEESLYDTSTCSILESEHVNRVTLGHLDGRYAFEDKHVKISFADCVAERLGHGNYDYKYTNDDAFSVVDLARESALISNKLYDEDWMLDTNKYLALCHILGLKNQPKYANYPDYDSDHIDALAIKANDLYPLMNIRATNRNSKEEQKIFVDYIEQCITK